MAQKLAQGEKNPLTIDKRESFDQQPVPQLNLKENIRDGLMILLESRKLQLKKSKGKGGGAARDSPGHHQHQHASANVTANSFISSKEGAGLAARNSL